MGLREAGLHQFSRGDPTACYSPDLALTSEGSGYPAFWQTILTFIGRRGSRKTDARNESRESSIKDVTYRLL